MKPHSTLHIVLSGIGCASLLIYILACSTSFSPDDSQVLYPSFDPQSGATSVAVYDRKTKHSEQLFSAIAPATSTNRDRLLIRAEWLPDGQHILVARLLGNDEKGLSFLLLPRGAKEPVREFAFPDFDEPAGVLEFPFAINGSQLVLNTSNRLAALDLFSGEITRSTATNKIVPLPAPDGKTLIGVLDLGDNHTEFGTIDPQTLAFKPAVQLTNQFADGCIPAFNPTDGRIALVITESNQPALQIIKDGQIEFSRPLNHSADKLVVGPFLDFTPDRKGVVSAYCAQADGQTNAEYGLIEIPLNQKPLRFTPLFHARKSSDDTDLLFAQPSLSHDGKTWAIATTYLYLQSESLAPADCALFLVNLTKAGRPVTKIPIPVPADRAKLVK
jgi:Tol biopolymer transport system component